MFDLTAKIPELRPKPVKRSVSLQEKRLGQEQRLKRSEVHSSPSWNEAEIKVFVDEFLKKPKDFGSISAIVEGKSVGDCIKFYYLNKKKLFKKTRVSRKIVRK